jgi:hypothetical protein
VTPLAFVIVALGAFRLTRLVGWDTITAPLRARLLGADDAGKPTRPRPRWGAAAFVHCAWCVGFWISVAAYAAWEFWPDATLIVMAPLAISAVVGVVAKNLDA